MELYLRITLQTTTINLTHKKQFTTGDSDHKHTLQNNFST